MLVLGIEFNLAACALGYPDTFKPIAPGPVKQSECQPGDVRQSCVYKYHSLLL